MLQGLVQNTLPFRPTFLLSRYNPDGKLARKWENAMTLDTQSWGYRRNAKLNDYYSIKVRFASYIKMIQFAFSLYLETFEAISGHNF